MKFSFVPCVIALTLLSLGLCETGFSRAPRLALRRHPAAAPKVAAEAGTQAISGGDLAGLWQSLTADESDPAYSYFDTTQMWFSGDGKIEIRSSSLDFFPDDPEDNYDLRTQTTGHWTATQGSLIITTETCVSRSTLDGTLNCFDADWTPDTASLADYEIAAVKGRKALIYHSGDLWEGDDTLYYVSATRSFTLQPLALASILRVRRPAIRPSGAEPRDLRGRFVGPRAAASLLILR